MHPFFLAMNEKINLSNYTVSVRIGDSVQFINLDVLAALCDKFLFEELTDIIAQSPTNTVIYSAVRNKTKFILQINPKSAECHV